MTSVKPKKRVFRTPKQLLQWVLKSLNAHISKYWFSQNGVFVWLAWVVPGLLGVFLSVFECFWVFLSVFECFWVKKKIVELFLRALNGSWPKKKRVFVDFWPKNNMVPIILGTIAELLAAFWSMNDVCEAQKMSKTAFTLGFEIVKSSYLTVFI